MLISFCDYILPRLDKKIKRYDNIVTIFRETVIFQ